MFWRAFFALEGPAERKSVSTKSLKHLEADRFEVRRQAKNLAPDSSAQAHNLRKRNGPLKFCVHQNCRATEPIKMNVLS